MKQTENSANDSANNSGKSIFGKYKIYIIGGILLIIGGYVLHVYNYCSTTEVDVLAYQNECKIGMSNTVTQVMGADKILTREEKKLIEAAKIGVSKFDNIGKVFAFVQEDNLQVAPESYAQVRQILEIYYGKFNAQQTSLNDMSRAYKHKRATALFGFVSRKLGFPSQEYIDARIDQMILDKVVNETYNSEDRTMPEIPISDGDSIK